MRWCKAKKENYKEAGRRVSLLELFPQFSPLQPSSQQHQPEELEHIINHIKAAVHRHRKIMHRLTVCCDVPTNNTFL
jgi:hypothetical protein